MNVNQDASGEYGLLRWQHELSKRSNTTLQVYYDRTDRDWQALSRLVTTTYDIDFQQRFGWGANHDIVWGAGYRNVTGINTNSASLALIPSRGNDQIYSLFAQDEITLRDDLHLTVGSKFEHNSYTGFEYQPSLALSWRLAHSQTLWASLSRVVRTPSFVERSLFEDVAALPNPVVGAPPLVVQISGNPALKSERGISWELGYRGELSPALSLDVVGFYTHYTRLSSVETQVPFLVLQPPVHLVLPSQFDNLMHGDTFGVELSAKWQVTPIWRLAASYTWLGIGLHLDPTSNSEPDRVSTEGSAPDHQTQLHSYLNLTPNLEFDSALYYVDSLPNGGAPAYTRLDVRLGWRPSQRFELSISGQNLAQPHHIEFTTGSTLFVPSEVPRSISIKATVRL